MNMLIKMSSLTGSVRHQLNCFYTHIWAENALEIHEMKNALSTVDVNNEDFKGSNLIERLLQYE